MLCGGGRTDWVSAYEIVPMDKMKDKLMEYVLTDQMAKWSMIPELE